MHDANQRIPSSKSLGGEDNELLCNRLLPPLRRRQIEEREWEKEAETERAYVMGMAAATERKRGIDAHAAANSCVGESHLREMMNKHLSRSRARALQGLRSKAKLTTRRGCRRNTNCTRLQNADSGQEHSKERERDRRTYR